MADPMPLWDYRVIHINVDSGKPPEPASPQQASDHLHGVLSPDFIQREFPEYYSSEGEKPRRGKHPAEQLQEFLNLLGRDGWELTTTAQVGRLLMFFFKRPLRPLPHKLSPDTNESL